MRAKFINEAYGQKDLVRMQDIKTKSAGDTEKEIKLAQTQAKIITKAEKAKARAEAAEEVFGVGSEIANIFNDRASELGGSYVTGRASKGVLAPVKGPTEKGEKIERGFKTQYILPSERIGGESVESGGSFQRRGDAMKKLGIGRYAKEDAPEVGGKRLSSAAILPLGSVNLGTGECKYFNVYDTYDGTAEVWKDGNKHKLVFTSGNSPLGKLGDTRDFYHDQTQQPISRNYNSWELVDYVPVSEMKELIRKYGGSMYGYTYK